MLREARRSPAHWSDCLKDFADDPGITACVKEKVRGGNRVVTANWNLSFDDIYLTARIDYECQAA